MTTYGSIADNTISVEYKPGLIATEAQVIKSLSTSEVTEQTPLTNTLKKSASTDHCHLRGDDGPQMDKRARRKLITASIFCLVFMLAEIVGGILASSLALATDAAHLLTDFASFLISLFALFISTRPATTSMSFGWHRAEVMGALVSVLLIWVVTGILLYSAVERVMSGEYEIQASIMLITAGLGVFFNIVMLTTLHEHGHSHGGHGHSHGDKGHGHSDQGHGHDDHGYSHIDVEAAEITKSSDKTEGKISSLGVSNGSITTSTTHVTQADKPKTNINVRAAFIHVVGDLIQSIGVLIAALIIYFKPEYKMADPICTFIFSVLVLFTTITILRDTINVLMEGTPRGVSFEAVKECLMTIKDVRELHNLRIWSLTVNRIAVAVHLVIAPSADHQEISKRAGAVLRERFSVYEFTVQTEEYVEDMKDCKQCINPS